MTETAPHEQLRDNPDIVSSEVREQWIRADQQARRATESYQALIEDTELKDEAKVERAQQVYHGAATKAAQQRKAVRERLLKESEQAFNASIPTPKGTSLRSADANSLLAAQAEADRIRRTIERRQEKAQKTPFEVNTEDILKEEYEKAMEIGGVEGAARARGVLRVGEELLSDDSYLPREQRHYDAIERARLRQVAADLIYTEPIKPPRALQGRRSSRMPGYERPRNTLVGGSGGSIAKSSRSKRKPSWK